VKKGFSLRLKLGLMLMSIKLKFSESILFQLGVAGKLSVKSGYGFLLLCMSRLIVGDCLLVLCYS